MRPKGLIKITKKKRRKTSCWNFNFIYAYVLFWKFWYFYHIRQKKKKKTNNSPLCSDVVYFAKISVSTGNHTEIFLIKNSLFLHCHLQDLGILISPVWRTSQLFVVSIKPHFFLALNLFITFDGKMITFHILRTISQILLVLMEFIDSKLSI